jgi:hypothetical protein
MIRQPQWAQVGAIAWITHSSCRKMDGVTHDDWNASP